MYTLVLIFYLITCFALTIVILLQSSKGGGLAGVFGGGGGMGAVFGGRGAATFLSRVTTVLAVAFMVFSLILSFLNPGSDGGGLVQEEREKRGTLPGANLPIVPSDETAGELPMSSEVGGEPAQSGSDTTR